MALKHSTMTLYSSPVDISSHRTRIVLAEKGINANIVYVDDGQRPNLPIKGLTVNADQSIPMLIDRDLVLSDPNIIAEYLDERFPHPPLLPIYPVYRAKSRLTIHTIEQGILRLICALERAKQDLAKAETIRKELSTQILSSAPLFEEADYFLSEEFTLVDCCLAPIFWRLGVLGIEIPASAKAMHNYMRRVFAREAFRESLSDQEVELVNC